MFSPSPEKIVLRPFKAHKAVLLGKALTAVAGVAAVAVVAAQASIGAGAAAALPSVAQTTAVSHSAWGAHHKHSHRHHHRHGKHGTWSAHPPTSWHGPQPHPTTPVPSPTTTTPAPTTTTPAPITSPPTTLSGWPDSTNTGVPVGTALSKYTGPCTITSPVTLTAVDASSCAALLIHAPNVVISKSLLPRIDATDGGSYSVSVTDSTVQGGDWSDGAIWGYNITALRVNVTGGQHSFHCNDNCSVTDSWLHDQYNPAGQGYHNNAFITNGGTNMVVRHNTLNCTAILNSTNGGCTADVSLFGDFGPVTHVTIDHNLLKANNSSISFCAYGGYQPSKAYPVSTYIQYTNNVFERGANGKCGVYGPVTSFQSGATGNVWSGNVFSDGAVVTP